MHSPCLLFITELVTLRMEADEYGNSQGECQ